jgi:hypothetical protein
MSTAQRVSRGFHRLGLLLCALSGVIALASEAAARPVGEGVFDGSANSIYRGCKHLWKATQLQTRNWPFLEIIAQAYFMH